MDPSMIEIARFFSKVPRSEQPAKPYSWKITIFWLLIVLLGGGYGLYFISRS